MKYFFRAWMLKAIILAGGGMAAETAQAQLTQPSRFEIPHKNSAYDYTVLSMADQGIALIHQKDKFETGKNFWELTLLDTALQQTWVTEIELSNQLNLIGYEYVFNEVYFLFRLGSNDLGDLHLIKADLGRHDVTEYVIEPKLDFKLAYFNIIGRSALLGGYVGRQPNVFLYEVSTGRSKVVPGFFTKNTELLDLRTNRNGTFNALLMDRSLTEKKQLIIRTIDESGALILEDVVETDQDKSLLSGLTSTLVRDELMVIGTWGQPNGKVALGIYTLVVDPFNKQAITYYSFADFNHFLDYNSEKKAERIRTRTARRKNQGKLPSWGVYVNAARIVESPEGFMLLSEVYSPSSNNANNNWNYYNPNYPPYGYGYNPYGYTPYSSRYSPYGYPYSNNVHRTDVSVKFSSVALFDANGKLSGDTGLKLQDVKLPALDQVSDFVSSDKKILQVYRAESDLHTAITSKSDFKTVEQATSKIRLSSPDDVLKRNDNDEGALRFWYDQYFFLWGYETVKTAGSGTERVFYVNKLKME